MLKFEEAESPEEPLKEICQETSVKKPKNINIGVFDVGTAVGNSTEVFGQEDVIWLPVSFIINW